MEIASVTDCGSDARSCRICGRALSNPVSVELGIGPVCRGAAESVKVRYRRKLFPKVCGINVSICEEDGLDGIKGFIKLFDFCFSCERFKKLNSYSGEPLDKQKRRLMYLKYLSKIKPIVWISRGEGDTAIYGACRWFHDVVVDGNMVINCLGFKKRRENIVRVTDSIRVSTPYGVRTLKGSDIIMQKTLDESKGEPNEQ